MRAHALSIVVAVVTSAAALPQTDDWKLRMAEGDAAGKVGDYSRAVDAYRAAAEVADHLALHPRRMAAWNALGAMYDAQGRFADAESAYRLALAAGDKAGIQATTDYALVLCNLATLSAEIGQHARAEKLVRQALAIPTLADPPNELRLAILQSGFGEILVANGHVKEAEPFLKAALPVLQRRTDVIGMAPGVLEGLGVVHFMQGDNAGAERYFRQSLSATEQESGTDYPPLARTLHNLAAATARLGRTQEAGELLRRAIDICERRLGQDHPLYGILLNDYASFLRVSGQKSEAKHLEARANQILKASGRRNGIGAVVDITALRRK